VLAGEDGAQLLLATGGAAASVEAPERACGGTGGGAGPAHHIFPGRWLVCTFCNDLRANGQLDDTLILFLSDNGACAEWDPFGFDLGVGSYTASA
jgi:hypothetical protein